MKRIATIIMAVFCLALLPLSAQKNAGSGEYRYRKAIEILEDGGDPKEARELLNENIKEHPKYILSYLGLASMDRRAKDYSSALRLIDKALENNHKKSEISDANLLWWKGTIYDEMGDLQKGLVVMQQAVKMARKQDKENLRDMLETLAQFHYDLKQYTESDKIYREMMALDETDQLPMVGLSRNMIARKEYDEALAMLEECKKYDSSYDEIYRFQMRAFEGKKEYKKMIDAMVTLYEKSDDFDYLDVEKFMMDKRYSMAVIKEKIASQKDNLAWKVILSEFYQESHMYTDAITILTDLINEYGNEVQLLETRSDCYLEIGMIDDALADMTKCIELSTDRRSAYFHGMRAQIYRCDGKYNEAISDLDIFVEQYPTRAYGYYARGWCKELSGNDTAAMEDYENGIAVNEDYPYIYLMRGEMYLKSGKKELAEADFQKVIQKDTVVEDGTCRQYALHFLGKDQEAIEWMDKLIESDTEDPGHWYDKACLLARMGRLNESVDAIEKSFEKGYRKFPHLKNDDDLDPIRERDDFKELVKKYEDLLHEELQRYSKDKVTESESIVTEVDMKKMYGGTFEVPCSVNGLPLKMIFDTGAADVTISSVEASFMLKNGYLADADVKGKRNYMTASGDIHEGTILRLKEVKLGDAVLKNVEASVVHSQKAPLLLGQSVLEKFGTITIDNVNSKLLIKQ